jgi:hypothetical protein
MELGAKNWEHMSQDNQVEDFSKHCNAILDSIKCEEI